MPSQIPEEQRTMQDARILKVQLGSIYATTEQRSLSCRFTEYNKVLFRIENDSIFLGDVEIKTLNGRRVLRIFNNQRRPTSEQVQYQYQPRHVHVSAPLDPIFLPAWALESVRHHLPSYATDGRVTLLDMQLVGPNIVKMQGVWMSRDRGVVVLNDKLIWMPSTGEHSSIIGSPGETAMLIFRDALTIEGLTRM